MYWDGFVAHTEIVDGIWKLMELLNIGYIACNVLGLWLDDLKLVSKYGNIDVSLEMWS